MDISTGIPRTIVYIKVLVQAFIKWYSCEYILSLYYFFGGDSLVLV